MEWYSYECFLCLDEFSEHKPRTFTSLCQHAICIECAKKLPSKNKCTYCSAVANPMFDNLEEISSFKLKDNTFINIPIPNEKLNVDLTQKLMALNYKKNDKVKNKNLKKSLCCCF